MPTLNYSRKATFGGVQYSELLTFNENAGFLIDFIRVTKGKASTAFVKITSSTGTITLPAAHGFATGVAVDIYWSGGARFKVSAVVSGNVMTISAGDGDNLPPSSTALVVAYRVNIAGAHGLVYAKFVAFQFSGHSGKFRLTTSADEIADITVLADGAELVCRNVEDGEENPFANMLEAGSSLYVSNGSAVDDGEFTLKGIIDATLNSSS